MIIKLFQAKIKLGQGSRMTESASCKTKSAPANAPVDTSASAQRAAKTQAIEILYKGVSKGAKTKPYKETNDNEMT